MAETVPENEEPSPYAPADPSRTREAINRRIEVLLREEEPLCGELARWARRFYFGDECCHTLLRAAERIAHLADKLENSAEAVERLEDDLENAQYRIDDLEDERDGYATEPAEFPPMMPETWPKVPA